MLELILKDAKIFISVYMFFALKAILEVFKFEFCQIKLNYNHG